MTDISLAGDAGHFMPDGMLVISGREGDVLNLGSATRSSRR